jgi:hypothetical protein
MIKICSSFEKKVDSPWRATAPGRICLECIGEFEAMFEMALGAGAPVGFSLGENIGENLVTKSLQRILVYTFQFPPFILYPPPLFIYFYVLYFIRSPPFILSYRLFLCLSFLFRFPFLSGFFLSSSTLISPFFPFPHLFAPLFPF